MKRKKLFMLTIITLIIMVLPFLLGFLLKREWLHFVSGQTGSWIEFWGSYIGAIIGAIVVFIVAKIEIKKRHDQQVEDLKRENDILYKRSIDGYLLRNKIKKIDEMIYLADELYNTVAKQEKEMARMIQLKLDDIAEALEISEEEKEEKYDAIYNNITNYTNQNMLRARKLTTLCSYVPEAEDELDNIQGLLTTLDQYAMRLFNTKKGYLDFCEFDSENKRVNYGFPVMGEIHQKLPEFIVYNLKDNLVENLSDVKQIAGEWMTLERN